MKFGEETEEQILRRDRDRWKSHAQFLLGAIFCILLFGALILLTVVAVESSKSKCESSCLGSGYGWVNDEDLGGCMCVDEEGFMRVPESAVNR